MNSRASVTEMAGDEPYRRVSPPLTGPDDADAPSGPLFWFHELAGEGPWKLRLTDEEWQAIIRGEIL